MADPQDFNSQLLEDVGGYAGPQQQQKPWANLANAANQEPQGAPQKGSPLKNVLGRFFYGFGQGALRAAGQPTDLDLQTHQMQMQQGQAAIQHTQAQTQQTLQSTQLLKNSAQMVDTPLGPMSAAAWTKVAPAYLGYQGRIGQAEINKRYITTPQGLYDTQNKDEHGMPSLVPNSGAGVVVTPEIAQQYGLTHDWVGKMAKMTDLAAMERGNAQVNGFVNGAAGPYTANKITGQATPVTSGGQGIGNSGIAVAQASQAAKAAWTPFSTQDGRVINVPQAFKEGIAGASSPLVKMGANAMIPAYDAENRLKQMVEQTQNPNPASDKALLFNHIAMTLGAVKGGRVNQAEIDSHLKARDLGQNINVAWDRVSKGLSLSPEQRDNFLRLGLEVRNSTWQTARSKAQAFGANNIPAETDPDLPAVPDSGIVGGGLNSLKPGAIPPRARQGMGGSGPARPSNVPAGYVYNANGPKGRGWYKP